MKKISSIVFLLVLLLLFSACGNDSEESSGGGVSDGGKPFEGEELTVLYMSGTYADAARLMAPEFEEQTGAKVTVAEDPYLQLFETGFSSLVSDTGEYDVMMVAFQWDGQFVPYMEPLTDELNGAIDDHIEAIANVTGVYNDVRFGVPMASDAYGVFYRKDIFEENGIKPDPNWTWEEYSEIAKQLTTGDMYGTAISGQVDQMTSYLMPRFHAKDGRIFTPDWEPMPDKDLYVEALEELQDLMATAMPEGVMSYDNNGQITAFTQGQLAMIEVWPSFARNLANDSDIADKWGLLPFPSGGNSNLSSWSLAVPKSSKNKELAQEWIKMFTTIDKQREFLNEIGIGPTIPELYVEDEALDKHPDFENHLISLENVLPVLKFNGAQEFTDYQDRQISAALAGSVTAEESAQNTIDQWTQILNENGKPEGEYKLK